LATLDIGRVCVKTAGRESGRYCVVLKKIDEQFVLITGPKILTGVKRRRCNIDHLEPTPHMLSIKEDASEKEVIEAYKKAGLVKKLNLKLPSPEVVKEAEKKVKKEEKKTKEKKPEKKGAKIKIKVPKLKKKKEEKKEKKTKKKKR
jgi:large subunit ribosomal protein L14e